MKSYFADAYMRQHLIVFQWRHMAAYIWVINGSGIDCSLKSLPELVLAYTLYLTYNKW